MGVLYQEIGQEADYSATRAALASMLTTTVGKRSRKRTRQQGEIVVAGGVNHGQIAHTIIIQSMGDVGPRVTTDQQSALRNRLARTPEPDALLGVVLRVMNVTDLAQIPAARWPDALRWVDELCDLAATAQMMAQDSKP